METQKLTFKEYENGLIRFKNLDGSDNHLAHKFFKLFDEKFNEFQDNYDKTPSDIKKMVENEGYEFIHSNNYKITTVINPSGLITVDREKEQAILIIF